MYKNIGAKLRGLAKAIGVISAISLAASACMILYAMSGEDWMIPIGIGCAGGSFLLLLSSWPIYAFGQITDDVHAMAEKKEDEKR